MAGVTILRVDPDDPAWDEDEEDALLRLYYQQNPDGLTPAELDQWAARWGLIEEVSP